MKKTGVTNLSTHQIILAYFIIHFLSVSLDYVYSWGRGVGLIDPNPLPNHFFTLGHLFRLYYIYLLVPSLMVLWVAQKEWKLTYPHIPSFPTYKIFMATLIVAGVYLTTLIILEGFGSRFHFLGYNTHYKAVLLFYCVVALFLGYAFRDQGTIQAVLFTSLGILAISELWELPLLFPYKNRFNPVIFLVGWLQRDLPLLLWFFMFKDIYIKFIRKWWPITIALIFVIAGLTIKAKGGGWSLSYGLLIRSSYALLLVFLPFTLKREKYIEKT